MQTDPPKEIEIKTRHFRYAARKWGKDSGVPTLALHGWLDNAASFDFLAPLLPELQVVALDFPGHGYSGHRPLGMRYHYLDYIADVMQVADALKWERMYLMGHSLGAGIASVLSGSFPERVEKLILIEGIGPMTRDPENSPQYLAKSVNQMNRIEQSIPPLYKTMEEMIDARSKAGDMSRASVEVLVKRGSVTLEEGITWRSDPRLRIVSPSYLTEDQVSAYLKAIQADTLLITAEQGLLRDTSMLEARTGHVTGIQHRVLPGGHHLHLDAPQDVADTINAFLDQ